MSEAKDKSAKSSEAERSGDARRASTPVAGSGTGSGGEPSGASTSAPNEERGAAEVSEATGASALVVQLVDAFREQVRRALDVELHDELGSTALAYVDHYLSLLHEETREPIISLVAANAGAWFGELIRREVGGFWIGDATQGQADPRRLRLLLEPQLIHFSPIDMVYEAIFSGTGGPGDPRLPEGTELDSAYHLRKRPLPGFEHEPSDHDWVLDRLAEAPPVPEDQFFSLTGRFETLELILELLASRDLDRGREPTRYHLNDYIAELASIAPS